MSTNTIVYDLSTVVLGTISPYPTVTIVINEKYSAAIYYTYHSLSARPIDYIQLNSGSENVLVKKTNPQAL